MGISIILSTESIHLKDTGLIEENQISILHLLT